MALLAAVALIPCIYGESLTRIDYTLPTSETRWFADLSVFDINTTPLPYTYGNTIVPV